MAAGVEYTFLAIFSQPTGQVPTHPIPSTHHGLHTASNERKRMGKGEMNIPPAACREKRHPRQKNTIKNMFYKEEQKP